MNVLVAYASKYGATRAIAERVGEVLRAAGHQVEVRAVADVGDASPYDAFVVGSAVYYGSWRKEAATFVRRNQALLASRPVWLFSSGPLGVKPGGSDRPDPAGVVPKDVAALEERLGPRAHHVFSGKMDRRRLGLLDRLVAGLPAFPGAEGDFRDWSDVDAWAQDIGRALAPVPAGSG